ncbi:hypothetical protein RYX36_005840 [Vicia faba]
MSRHRRQPSRAIPSEIFAADDIFSKPFDLAQVITIQEDEPTTAPPPSPSPSPVTTTNSTPAVTTSPVKSNSPAVGKSA